MSKNILVTGSTGKQGRALISTILSSPQSSDFTIYALTRNPSSPSALFLADLSSSIRLLAGNLDDVPAIFSSLLTATSGASIWGVSSVQQATMDGATPEREETQGKALIDHALEHNVQRFVYSSVDRGGDNRSWENPTNVPHFRSKHNIEQYLVSQTANGDKMPYLIIRPVAFMDLLVPGFMGKVFATLMKIGLRPGKKNQYVAVRDIGVFAAQGFLQAKSPEYRNKAISLAGDELSWEEFDRVFVEKTGYSVPVTYESLGRVFRWLKDDIGKMLQWFDDEGYGADIVKLKEMHPGLMGLGEWLENESGFRKA
ncbi:MAG: hypothetical protein Q9222_001185 [Ikaeria aurantiellina]